MSELKDTKSFSINDILSWKENGELILSPKYQRNKVWNLNAKSYLIDTILRGYPIPQIFIRQQIDLSTRKTIREVIDGQQRITAIIEYYENLFKILKSHNKEFANLSFKEIPDEDKENFLNYNINFEVIKIKNDSKIYEMFARLNTNNIALNKQELRNAQYWGEFKVFVLRKSSEYKDIFVEKKIFKDKDLIRMNDVDFMNSLIIHLIDGIITDSNAKTDSYYKKYDPEFTNQDHIENKLDKIFLIIEEIFYNPLFTSKIYYRKNYFWTLFATINHQVFGTLGTDIQRNPDFNAENFMLNLNSFISKISLFESEILSAEYDPENSTHNFLEFVRYHSTRTTSKDERTIRIKILSQFLSK